MNNMNNMNNTNNNKENLNDNIDENLNDNVEENLNDNIDENLNDINIRNYNNDDNIIIYYHYYNNDNIINEINEINYYNIINGDDNNDEINQDDLPDLIELNENEINQDDLPDLIELTDNENNYDDLPDLIELNDQNDQNDNFADDILQPLNENHQLPPPHSHLLNSDQIDNMINNKHNEIMNYAYENMMNIDNNILEFINLCYLKNLQYDESITETFRYTIRTVFNDGLQYELKMLVSSILSYSITGINLLFNENFDLIIDLLGSEVRRLLRQGFAFQIFSNMFYNQNSLQSVQSVQSVQMEDVKLVVEKEELDKIPIKQYKELSTELQETNTKCVICQDEFYNNDSVRILECDHIYHKDCVDGWLTNHSHKCPCCRKSSAKYQAKL